MSIRPISGGVCPACLYPISRLQTTYTCVCGYEASGQLLTAYQDSSPLVVQLLGWSDHGKTAYLAALSFIFSRLGSIWPEYTPLDGTSETQKQRTEAFRLVREGRLPEKTPRPKKSSSDSSAVAAVVPRHTYLLRNLPVWGNRVVMFHDPAGDLCDEMKMSEEDLPFLARAPVSLMFLSADNLRGNDYRTMDMLLNSYIQTLQGSGVQSSEPRVVIVVLSKVDLYLGQLPPEIRYYVESDPLWPLLFTNVHPATITQADAAREELEDIQLYCERMYDIENRLRDWLANEPPLKTLQLEAKRHNIDLRFSVVSSTGEEVRDHGRLNNHWRPHRVLDPFLWALKLTDGREGVVSAWKRSGADASIAAPASEGRFSLLIRDRRRFDSERKVNLQRESGDLGAAIPELGGLTFVRENSGVRFCLSAPRNDFFRHDLRGVERLSSTEAVLQPGESISTDDWQVELRAGHFQPSNT